LRDRKLRRSFCACHAKRECWSGLTALMSGSTPSPELNSKTAFGRSFCLSQRRSRVSSDSAPPKKSGPGFLRGPILYGARCTSDCAAITDLYRHGHSCCQTALNCASRSSARPVRALACWTAGNSPAKLRRPHEPALALVRCGMQRAFSLWATTLEIKEARQLRRDVWFASRVC
jgi:hypothetical protein